MMQPDKFRAYPVNVTCGRLGESPEPMWVVAGGRNYKGFGRIPRFAGSRGEAEVVADALQTYREQLEAWRKAQLDKLRWGLQTAEDMRARIPYALNIVREASRLALEEFDAD